MFKSKLQKEFAHSHERDQYCEFESILRNEYSTKDETIILLGNYTLINGSYSSEIDALVIKKDAIIVIDFKDNNGNLIFSESLKWTIDELEVKGGSFTNPLFQVRAYKSNLSNFLKTNVGSFSDEGSKSNFGHINGIILFSGDIIYKKDEIPGKLRSWFRITDMKNILLNIKNITSREINFNDEDINKLLELLKIDIPNPATIIEKPVTIIPIHKTKKIKDTTEGKILDYYIACLEQEQLKQLELIVKRNRDNNYDNINSFRLLSDKGSMLFENNESVLKINIDVNLKEFITAEQKRPNPRTLFYGYSIITKNSNGYETIYPVFYCQMKYDSVKEIIEKEVFGEYLFNKSFLNNLGYKDREEIESKSYEIDNINSFVDKIEYIKKLSSENTNDIELGNQTIIFFSEANAFIRNLLSELGEGKYGLSNKANLESLEGNISKHLINKLKVGKNTLNEEIPFLEIFKLNKSQEIAVNSAITNKFSVITGPPGTGKSQVVLNILANMIFEGKSVLFASKNNKAVDVVRERFVNEILKAQGMDDFMVRIGTKKIMEKTIMQLRGLISKLSLGTVVFDENNFTTLKNKLIEINRDIFKANKNISSSKSYLKSIESLK